MFRTLLSNLNKTVVMTISNHRNDHPNKIYLSEMDTHILRLHQKVMTKINHKRLMRSATIYKFSASPRPYYLHSKHITDSFIVVASSMPLF